MSFDKLLRKVSHAETAVEAQGRRTSADWRQLKRSWKAAWTPGRIIVAGLLSGFVVGRNDPQKALGGSGILRLLGSLSNLMATHHAREAADHAEDATQAAEQDNQHFGNEPSLRQASDTTASDSIHMPTATAEAYEP